MNALVNCLFVGFGGMIGSVLRYLLGLLPYKHESGFPFITLGINVLGALLIGIIVALAAKSSHVDQRIILFLKVGICGGFTTFSTFALETQNLLHGGKVIVGLLYAVLSVVLCIAAISTMNALIE